MTAPNSYKPKKIKKILSVKEKEKRKRKKKERKKRKIYQTPPEKANHLLSFTSNTLL
jgi:hypothetical protein